jgi:hypothetical protein
MYLCLFVGLCLFVLSQQLLLSPLFPPISSHFSFFSELFAESMTERLHRAVQDKDTLIAQLQQRCDKAEHTATQQTMAARSLGEQILALRSQKSTVAEVMFYFWGLCGREVLMMVGRR